MVKWLVWLIDAANHRNLRIVCNCCGEVEVVRTAPLRTTPALRDYLVAEDVERTMRRNGCSDTQMLAMSMN